MARKFFYICAGMFLLALAYHLGAENADAQASRVRQPDALVARSLRIVDEVGRTRMELALDDGDPYLVLNHANGQIAAAISMRSGRGAFFAVSDDQGRTRAMLSSGEGTNLTLTDSRGTERIQLAVTGADAPTITLMDETKAMRASLYIERDTGALSFFGRDGKLLWHAQ